MRKERNDLPAPFNNVGKDTSTPGRPPMPVRAAHTIFRHRGNSALIAVALTLSGCGAQSQSPAQTSDLTPTAARGLPPSGASGSSTPGTQGVTLVLDRQRYTPGDIIHVTLFNGGARGISVAGGKLACTVADVEQKSAQGWQKTSVMPCAAADFSEAVAIAAGASYDTAIATRSGAAAVAAGM
jgi:hypothetical protein